MFALVTELSTQYASLSELHEIEGILYLQSPVVEITAPINVQWSPLPSQHGVFISWQLGESYYGLPYPNISFFLKIQYAVNLTEATPRLEVVGKV